MWDGQESFYSFEGYEVFAVDQSGRQSHSTRLAHLAPPGRGNFRVEAVEKMSWESAPAERACHDGHGFDVVISSALLHFARNEEHWHAMVNEMWRVLRTGGILFARLASTIGLEQQVELIEGRRYHLPDGSDRFLVDEACCATSAFRWEFIEPIKTTVVENLRAMTTWVLIKK